MNAPVRQMVVLWIGLLWTGSPILSARSQMPAEPKALQPPTQLTPLQQELNQDYQQGKEAYNKNDYPSAIGLFQRGLEKATAAKEEQYVARFLNALGAMAYSQGDLKGAEDYFRKALTLQVKLALNSLAVADTYNNLGGVAWKQGDL